MIEITRESIIAAYRKCGLQPCIRTTFRPSSNKCCPLCALALTNGQSITTINQAYENFEAFPAVSNYLQHSGITVKDIDTFAGGIDNVRFGDSRDDSSIYLLGKEIGESIRSGKLLEEINNVTT